MTQLKTLKDCEYVGEGVTVRWSDIHEGGLQASHIREAARAMIKTDDSVLVQEFYGPEKFKEYFTPDINDSLTEQELQGVSCAMMIMTEATSIRRTLRHFLNLE